MARDEAREKVIPTYMGLIKQIDDQMGVLMKFLGGARPARHHHDRVHLRSRRLSRRSLDGREGSVPRSVGEDSADRDRSVDGGRRHARHASAMRWSKAIDLAPTFIDYFGGKPPDHILEGRSLLPLLRGESAADWRKVVFSEYDYCHAGCAAEAEPADRAMPPVHGVRRPLEIHPRLRLPPDAVRSRNRSGGICSIAATIPRAPTSSRGCRPRCSTGRCIPTTTSPRRNEKIAAYADNQLQVKGGILIGIWDEAELAAIRDGIAQRAKL